MSIGQRIILIGSSGSGKSITGEQLAARLGVPFIELDALHWEEGWVPADDRVFHNRIRATTSGEAWVMAGNYTSKQQHVSWPLADTVVWLDLPLVTVVRRAALRTWRRWWRHEELWNGNRESLRDNLSFWDTEKSLVAYTLKTHRARGRLFEAAMCDQRWSHIAFVRLRSPEEVGRWLARVPAAANARGQAASQPTSDAAPAAGSRPS